MQIPKKDEKTSKNDESGIGTFLKMLTTDVYMKLLKGYIVYIWKNFYLVVNIVHRIA